MKRILTVTIITMCTVFALAQEHHHHDEENTNHDIFSCGFGQYGGIDLSLMDLTQKPQDDFYNYVNGTWMKKAEIPSDRSRWGSFDELRENTDENTLKVLKNSLVQQFENGTDGQKVKDYYNCIIDWKSRNEQGMEPLQKNIAKIQAIKSYEELQQYLREANKYGGNPFFGFGVSPHMKNSNAYAVYMGAVNLGLSRDYYQKKDEKNEKVLAQYKVYIEKLLHLANQSQISAEKIIAFEKELANTLKPVEKIRDAKLRYNPYDLKGLLELSKFNEYTKLLEHYNVKTDSVIIGEKDYYLNMDKFLNPSNLEIIKDYLVFSIINNGCSYISQEFDELNFDFYGRALRGQKEQRSMDKRALASINGTMGEILGKLYVKEYFPEEAKAKAMEMVNYLKRSFKNHIENLTWMSPETKKKALEKLSKFNVKIGYPDKWKDYSGISIIGSDKGGSYYENTRAISEWRFNENLQKLGKPVDKTEWFMSPQTVNAYYSSTFNEIVFPAAILQAPFYDYKEDVAVNFGGIGAVIGHEISHGFDDSGSQYDGDGNLVDWWTKEDKENFNKATEALAAQYSAYEPLPGVFVNGKFTLGENIADLGGVSVAYDALQLYLKEKGAIDKIDNFTQEQRFFLSWATIWRTKSTDQALIDQVKTDPHSPGMYRATGPLMNSNPFYKAFGVKKGNKMYKEENSRIIIW